MKTNLAPNRCAVASICLAGLLSACATADFKPYSGIQQNWPTAPGGFVDTKYAVPTYYGPPPRQYDVIGYLNATTAPVRQKGVVGYAARRARDLGGDAIIVLDEGSEYAGTYVSGSGHTTADLTGYSVGNTFYGSGTARTSYNAAAYPMFKGKASAIVIRFKR